MYLGFSKWVFTGLGKTWLLIRMKQTACFFFKKTCSFVFPFVAKVRLKALFQCTERVQIFSIQLSDQKCDFASFLNTQICSKRTIGEAQSRAFYVIHALSELSTFKIFSFGARHSYVKKKLFVIV